MDFLEFIETAVFTKRAAHVGLSDEAILELQLALLSNPKAGPIDPGTGGLRKVRFSDARRNKGKRSGLRVHYLWLPHTGRMYLIYLYSKGDEDTLTVQQKRRLRGVVSLIKERGG